MVLTVRAARSRSRAADRERAPAAVGRRATLAAAAATGAAAPTESAADDAGSERRAASQRHAAVSSTPTTSARHYRGVGTILTWRGRTFYESRPMHQLSYSILAGDVCFVNNLFRSILPVVPTECDVLNVCRQHNDRERKFKEQHAKMWENIAGAKRYSHPRGFNTAGARGVAPAVPTPLRHCEGPPERK